MESILWGIVMILLLVVLIAISLYFGRKSSSTVITNLQSNIPVYCINLENETVRKMHIQMAFSKLSIEFVPAVDTREDRWMQYQHHLDEKGMTELIENIQYKKRDDHYQLTPGAIGCFLSHIRCWDKIQKPVALILEDDSLPKPHFHTELELILKNMPADTDLFLLSYIVNGEKTLMSQGSLHFYHVNQDCVFYLLNCYLITQQGIQKIMAHFHQRGKKFHKQIDSYLSDMIGEGQLNVYCTLSNICPQTFVSPTTIQTLEMNY
jgi:GR25 family glycosyltransferase involved in LPS biosynthesis